MYHASAKLTFGGGEKIFGVKKAPGGAKKLQGAPKSSRGRKKPIIKTEKIVATFFFLGDSKKCVLYRGAKNFSRGRRMVNMVNVTPLDMELSYHLLSLLFLVKQFFFSIYICENFHEICKICPKIPMAIKINIQTVY